MLDVLMYGSNIFAEEKFLRYPCKTEGRWRLMLMGGSWLTGCLVVS